MPKRKFSKFRGRKYRKRSIRRRWTKKKGFRSKFNKKFKPTIRQFGGHGGGYLYPDTAFTKIKYDTGWVNNVTNPNTIDFRGNSVYDPEYATGGHSPLMFETFAYMYNTYLVAASKFTLEVWDNSGAQIVDHIVYPSNFSSLSFPSNILFAKEQPYATVKTTQYLPSSQIPNRIKIKRFMTTKKILGLKGSLFMNEECKSTINDNPSAPGSWFWRYWINRAGGTSSINIWYRANITYYVYFLERAEFRQNQATISDVMPSREEPTSTRLELPVTD